MSTSLPAITPDICKVCANYDWDYDEWKDLIYRYCTKKVWFPTRKKTCARWKALTTTEKEKER